MGLNSDKTSQVFVVLIFAVFYQMLYVFVPQWYSHPSFINGFAAEVLLGRYHTRVVPIGPTVRGVIAFPIFGNMMGCDYLSCVPVGPFAGELWHFEYFSTTAVRHFEF